MTNRPNTNTTGQRIIQGMVLSLGAGAGWAGLSFLFGLWDEASFRYQVALYLYMLIGTMLVFGVFAYILGRSEEQFAQLSFRDKLTELHNPRYFDETLEAEFSNAVRHDRSLGLIIFDLDHFKRINDTYGHQAGDEVLRTVARRVKRHVRRGDTLARVGGEEFAMILPGTATEGAYLLAERLRREVRETPVPLPSGAEETIRISLGVAALDRVEAHSPEELVSRADKALYEAKEAGRDRTVAAEYDPKQKNRGTTTQ